MQSHLINTREQLSEESRKAFQEFQKNQKDCTLKAHKILIAFFALVNIILFLFIILYKFQVSSLQNSISSTQQEISVIKKETDSQYEKATHKIININALFNFFDTKFFSLTIKNIDEVNMLKDFLSFLGDKDHLHLTMLYQTYQGDLYETINELASTYENLLIVVQTRRDVRFGGFITFGSGVYGNKTKDYVISDDNAFMFSFDNQKKYPVIKGENAFTLLKDGVFKFGNDDLVVVKNYTDEKSMSKFPMNYESGKYNNTNTNILTGEEKETFEINAIEIFTIFQY